MKDVSLIVYPAADPTTAKRFFRELIGTDPYVDSPQYVGYKSADMEIGLDPNGKREHGALAYWTVSDIAASVKALVAAGGTVVQEIYRRRLRNAGRQRQRAQRRDRGVTTTAEELRD